MSNIYDWGFLQSFIEDVCKGLKYEFELLIQNEYPFKSLQLFELPIEFSVGLLFLKININLWYKENKYTERLFSSWLFFSQWQQYKDIPFGCWVHGVPVLPVGPRKKQFLSLLKQVYAILLTDNGLKFTNYLVMPVRETAIQGLPFNAALSIRSSSKECQSCTREFYLLKQFLSGIVNIQKMMQNEKELTANNFQRKHKPKFGQSIYPQAT